MSVIMEYNYDVELTLAYGTDSISLNDMVKAIIINHDFDKNNMPIIYVQISLSPDQYKTVLKHKEDGHMIFTIYKYDVTSSSQLKKKYISDSFTYIMTSDPDYNDSTNSGSTERFSVQSPSDKSEMEATSYFTGYIALIKEESLNDNNQINNGIVKNSNLKSIIHRFTKHMNMAMEAIDGSHNVIIDQLIIPPLSTVTELLKYLNTLYSFYGSGYRYFRDFDKTYLMSNDGNPLNLHDGSYSKILIDITDPMLVKDYAASMEIDVNNKAYIIKVDANNTSIKVNQSTDKDYNSIIAVDSYGNTSKVDLNVSSHSDSKEKVQFEKVSNSNFTTLSEDKSIVESSSVVLTVVKSNVDSSILTPNKEYLISNYKANASYNGRYVLSSKKEILKREGNFVITSAFVLRKVSDS